MIETDEAVLVAFAVVPVAGSARCPGNPSTAVTIELSEPLGERWIYDGLHFPPKPLTADGDPQDVVGVAQLVPVNPNGSESRRPKPLTAAGDPQTSSE